MIFQIVTIRYKFRKIHDNPKINVLTIVIDNNNFFYTENGYRI